MTRNGGAGLHRRLFRLLLLVLPRGFRERYGREMTAFFLARLERARDRGGAPAVLRLWARTVTDVVRTAVAERRGRRRRPIDGTHGGPADTWTRRREGGVGHWIGDLGHAARRLARTPAFTVAAVAILAVGIGANTAAFSLVDALLFRPPPFRAPDRLVRVYQDSDDGEPSSNSFPAYRDMAEMDGVFSGVAAVSPDGATWEARDGPRQVSVEYATSSYLPVLELEPSRGRWFSAEYDVPGAEALAVVSHHTWTTEMGADPGVLGRTIRLNGKPVTVVGVGPERFNGEASTVTDFWLSISATPVGGAFRVANLDRRQDHWYLVTARLAPGVEVPRAQAAMDGLAQRLADEYPELDRGRGITVFRYGDVRVHPSADGGLMSAGLGLLVVVGLVLLLACSNLANLLLVRGVSRSSEMAVRQAMGASRGRVAWLFLSEALVLSALGGGAGLLLARWAVQVLSGVPLPPLRGATIDVSLDHRVLLFALGLIAVTGVLFGLAPALRTAGADVAATLREEERSSSGGRSSALLRKGLVAVQVAVCLVLLVGAGLLTRSLANARGVDPGVDVDRIAVVGTSLPQTGIPQEEWPEIIREIRTQIAGLPGVESVALTSRLPVQRRGTTTTVVEGYTPPAGTGAVELAYAVVSRDYFETMGIRRLAGRTFTLNDGPGTPAVVVVNETAARRFWKGDAVGRRMRAQDNPDGWSRVVGVVEDVKVSSLQEPPTPMFYVSAEQVGLGSFAVVARTDGDPAVLAASLRDQLQAVRASLPVTSLGTLSSHMGEALSGPRTAAALVGVFSLLALILASLGIYAVVSFAVAQRAAEMGIRVALGAGRRRVVRMVVGESLVTVALGLLAGLAVVVPLAPRLEGMLFRIDALDPVTFLAGAGLLVAVGALAAWLPARRAAGANPVEVLRSE